MLREVFEADMSLVPDAAFLYVNLHVLAEGVVKADGARGRVVFEDA